MRFSRDSASRLVDALVNFSRNSLYEYGNLRGRANLSKSLWNDAKTQDYFDALSNLDATMKISFNTLVEYKNNLARKIREL